MTQRLLDPEGRALTYGGQQRWQLALARWLRERGHAVRVHQRGARAFATTLEEDIAVFGHACALDWTGTLAFNRLAHRAIPAGAPVVYMVEDTAFPRCRRRSVVVQHGVWWDGEYGWLKQRAAERLARAAVERTAATVCVDTNFINWYRARWPDADDAKLCFVPNFVDAQLGPQPEQPAAQVAPGAPLTICFPRRSEPRRGPWLMVAAASALAQQAPRLRFRFAVGSGSATEELRQRLLVSAIGVDRWSIESVPFERMAELYAASAIAVVPTLCGEGTSLAALEAMHFGCAVVATWVGGLPNLIVEGFSGLLVPPDVHALEQALARLAGDDALRARLGRNAMAIAAEHGLARWRARVAPVLERALRLDAP